MPPDIPFEHARWAFRFSPDGEDVLAAYATRDTALLMPASGGEARQVSWAPSRLSAYHWSEPDRDVRYRPAYAALGHHCAYLAQSFPGGAWPASS